MIDQKFIFEKRAYNEDASPEEIQAIKDRVFIYEEGILFLDELPIMSPFSISLMFDQVEVLGEKMGRHGLIVDISNTQRADAVNRRVINERFKYLCEKLTHVSFCTGKNFLINTVVRFVMYQTDLNSFSISKTIEDAAAALKNKL